MSISNETYIKEGNEVERNFKEKLVSIASLYGYTTEQIVYDHEKYKKNIDEYASRTKKAMDDGIHIIYQAALPYRFGICDFLMRSDVKFNKEVMFIEIGLTRKMRYRNGKWFYYVMEVKSDTIRHYPETADDYYGNLSKRMGLDSVNVKDSARVNVISKYFQYYEPFKKQATRYNNGLSELQGFPIHFVMFISPRTSTAKDKNTEEKRGSMEKEREYDHSFSSFSILMDVSITPIYKKVSQSAVVPTTIPSQKPEYSKYVSLFSIQHRTLGLLAKTKQPSTFHKVSQERFDDTLNYPIHIVFHNGINDNSPKTLTTVGFLQTDLKHLLKIFLEQYKSSKIIINSLDLYTLKKACCHFNLDCSHLNTSDYFKKINEETLKHIEYLIDDVINLSYKNWIQDRKEINLNFSKEAKMILSSTLPKNPKKYQP